MLSVQVQTLVKILLHRCCLQYGSIVLCILSNVPMSLANPYCSHHILGTQKCMEADGFHACGVRYTKNLPVFTSIMIPLSFNVFFACAYPWPFKELPKMPRLWKGTMIEVFSSRKDFQVFMDFPCFYIYTLHMAMGNLARSLHNL